jgi:hypothetical protein
MHSSRLYPIVGVVVGIVGLFIKALTTDGEGLLPTLSQASDAFPDGIPTIWGGLATWAQFMIVILIAVVLVAALRPVISDQLDRTTGAVVAVVGVAMLAYTVSEWLDAGDKADALQAGFLQAAQGGIIPDAYTVNTSVGFIILLVGTVLVAFGGALGFRTGDDADL